MGMRYLLDDDLLFVVKNMGVVLFFGVGVVNKLVGVWFLLIIGVLLLMDINGEVFE